MYKYTSINIENKQILCYFVLSEAIMNPIKIVVSGYIGFDNFGDEALLSVLLKNLKEQHCELTVITSNPQKTKFVHGVKTVKTFDVIGIINALLKTNFLVSGGGSLLQDKTSLKSLLYYLFVIFCAKIFRKKVIIYSQGIGPINNWFARLITKQILKSCDLLTVRDEKSLFLLRGWGINNVVLEADAVFNLEVPKYEPQNCVGIQLRNWKFLSTSFIDELVNQVIVNFPDKKILLFSFQDELDYEICQAFQAKLTLKAPHISTQIVQNNYSNRILENFKTLEYLIAMRFHACLLATKLGIKTLAINYDEKVEKLAKSAQIPFVNLNEETKLGQKMELLKEVDVLKMLEFANSQKYNFEKMNLLISSSELN